VVSFHLGYFGGGWIGVDLFFVLSGFLITSLLLDERVATGVVRLRAFWARRARRLLPGLLLLLAVLALYAWAGGPGVVAAQVRSPALASLLYVANWQQLASGHGYFAQFQAPNPLLHTWSLAIEEQYYLAWPLLFLALAWWARRRSARALVAVTGSLALASALWMGVSAHLFGVDRAYLGTDTRSWELLLGGLGAMVWRPGRAARGTRAWAVATPLALGGLALGAVFAGGPPGWVWDGGLVALAGCGLVVVVGSVEHPDGVVARLLGIGPLRWLGRLSYSLYLWHWPVIVILNGTTTGLSGSPLLLCRLGVMLGAACASYYVVERPLRRADWSLPWRRALVPVGVCAVVAATLTALATPTQAATARVVVRAPAPATRTPAIELPVGRVVSPAAPLRVWLIGDSVMSDSSPGIIAALDATGDVDVVLNSSFGGWGLSTDPGWAPYRAQVISEYHPELIIGTWSWDDPLAQGAPGPYLAELRGELRSMLTPGNGVDGVVLLQFPQVGPSPYYLDPAAAELAWAAQNDRQLAWNALAQAATASFPGHALYLRTDQLFAPGDRYFTWFRTPGGGWLRARKIDDTHVCPYGAAEFGALVVRDLTLVFELAPLRSGWELGSWVHDPRYSDPPGSCPADQPPPGYRGVAVPGRTS